jgi:S-methylmethionine-dependent homocysteine/selenocysteine methylase
MSPLPPADRLARLRAGATFATDGGLETVLIFHEGLDLPHFAAFDLLRTQEGTARLRAYYEPYLRLAVDRGVGFVLETPTWRASPDWAERLGLGEGELEETLRAAVRLAEELRAEHETDRTPVLISGNLGPRGDGYDASTRVPAAEAERYHGIAVRAFAAAGADLVTALTMTHVEEAVGIVRAAVAHDLPVVISFTVETDGRLPGGEALPAAIEQVDAETGRAPLHYLINCAHPSHFDAVLRAGGAWVERVGGLRANASTRSHAELDEADTLDEGDPVELAAGYAALRPLLPRAAVVGGCCGTDVRHVERALDAWLGAGRGAPA